MKNKTNEELLRARSIISVAEIKLNGKVLIITPIILIILNLFSISVQFNF